MIGDKKSALYVLHGVLCSCEPIDYSLLLVFLEKFIEHIPIYPGGYSKKLTVRNTMDFFYRLSLHQQQKPVPSK